MSRRFGIEQYARGLKRSGGDNDDLRKCFAVLARVAINVVNAGGTAAGVDDQIADNGVADKSEFTCASGGRKRH